MVKQAMRDGRAGAGFETFWQDLYFGVRQLRRNPVFAVAAILTLGVGIGANTAIFSFVNSVLLRPLPYPEPDRLSVIWSQLGNSSARLPPCLSYTRSGSAPRSSTR